MLAMYSIGSYISVGKVSSYCSSYPPTAVPTLLRSITMDTFPALKPMKLVERADGLMQHAEVLYNKHRPIMRPDDRMLAEDRMTR